MRILLFIWSYVEKIIVDGLISRVRGGGSWGWRGVCVWGGGGRVCVCGGGGNFLYMEWHGSACRMTPFFSAARYWPPSFNKKCMNDPIFLDSYVKGPTFLTSWYMHIFFVQRFFEVACSLGSQWIDCDICLTTSNKWVQKKKKRKKKSKGSIWIGQHFG